MLPTLHSCGLDEADPISWYVVWARPWWLVHGVEHNPNPANESHSFAISFQPLEKSLFTVGVAKLARSNTSADVGCLTQTCLKTKTYLNNIGKLT